MKSKRKKEGSIIMLLAVAFIFIAFIVGSTGMHLMIADMLGSAVDHVLFDDDDQAQKYKEKFGQ